MTRIIAILLTVAIYGCDAPAATSPYADGGMDAMVTTMDGGIDASDVDAGTDAAMPTQDAGTDMGQADAGTDAGTADAGTADAGPQEWIGSCSASDPVQNTYVMSTGDMLNGFARGADFGATVFDLDGVDNTAGGTVAGCGQQDYAGTFAPYPGTDNAFKRLLGTEASTSALSLLLGQTLRNAHLPTSSSALGHAYIDFKVTHASTPAFPWNDPCVGVIVRTYTDQHEVSELRMQGSIVNNVITISSTGYLDFELPMPDSAVQFLNSNGYCVAGGCSLGTIRFRLYQPKFRIRVGGTMSTWNWLDASIAGGVFDGASVADPMNVYGALESGGGKIGSDLDTLAAQIGIQQAISNPTMMSSTVLKYRDLMMNPFGSYANQCTATTPPDALSVQVRVN